MLYFGIQSTAIDLFCSLIFTSSVMEIEVCKKIAYFPGVLKYYDWLRGRPRNTLMARNARECHSPTCIFSPFVAYTMFVC